MTHVFTVSTGTPGILAWVLSEGSRAIGHALLFVTATSGRLIEAHTEGEETVTIMTDSEQCEPDSTSTIIHTVDTSPFDEEAFNSALAQLDEDLDDIDAVEVSSEMLAMAREALQSLAEREGENIEEWAKRLALQATKVG